MARLSPPWLWSAWVAVLVSGCLPAPAVDAAPDPPAAEELVSLAPGSFEMGCAEVELDCPQEELPAHTVTLTRGFALGRTEVSQGRWEEVAGANPSHFAACGADCPVEQVTWYEALIFANLRSASEGLAECFALLGCSGTLGLDMECAGAEVRAASGSVHDCEGYRLPTEAELEYAARAGTDLLYAGSDEVDEVAWHAGNSAEATHPVASLEPNAWGLYDLSGNVWEQAWDRWAPDSYADSPSVDPEGPDSGSLRVIRGGCWAYDADSARAATRDEDEPGRRVADKGFRLARTVP